MGCQLESDKSTSCAWERLVAGRPFLTVFRLDSAVQEPQVDQKQSCLKSKAVTNTSHS